MVDIEEIPEKFIAYFENEGMECEYVKRTKLLHLEISLDGCLPPVEFVVTFNETGFVTTAITDFVADDEVQKAALQDYITKINYTENAGCFVMNPEYRGQVSYRMYTSIEGLDTIPDRFIENAVTIPLHAIYKYSDGFLNLQMGLSNPETEFNSAERANLAKKYSYNEEDRAPLLSIPKKQDETEQDTEIPTNSNQTASNQLIPAIYLDQYFLLQELAEEGSADAEYELGRYFFVGAHTGRPQYDKAIEHWTRAAELGNLNAAFNLGKIYYDGEHAEEDREKSSYYYKIAAEGGDAEAQFIIGNHYQHGIGVSVDFQKANEWYQRSAEQGNLDALTNLGINYMEGRGVEQDKKTAVDYFSKAAQKEYGNAEYCLGLSYYYGEGVERDKRQAFLLFIRANAHRNPNGLNLVGLMYIQGEIVEQNIEEAVSCWTEGADNGCELCTENLYHYYSAGRYANPEKAQYWKQILEEYCGISTESLCKSDTGYVVKVDYDNNTMIIPYDREDEE